MQINADDSTDASWFPKISTENGRQDLYIKLLIVAQGPKQVYLIADSWELCIIFDLEKKRNISWRTDNFHQIQTNCPISRSVCVAVSQEKHNKKWQ